MPDEPEWIQPAGESTPPQPAGQPDQCVVNG